MHAFSFGQRSNNICHVNTVSPNQLDVVHVLQTVLVHRSHDEDTGQYFM